jgi:hypothetical protein
MSEPRPLLTEAPTNAHARLLASAELDVPPREGRARLIASLGLQAATVVSTSTVAATAWGAGGVTVIAKWIAVGMVVGFATTGTVHVVEQRLAGSVVEPQALPTAANEAAAKRGPEQPVPVAPSARAAEPVNEPRAADGEKELPNRGAAARLPAGRTESGPIPNATKKGTLAEEVAALDLARRALDARDPARALGMLDAHERRFDKPRLAPEATLLRIETLIAAERRDDARRLAQGLLSSQPDTPHAERVRAILRDLASKP